MTGTGPVAPRERNTLLDLLHGAALLGVVLVDLPMFFRPVWTEFLPTKVLAEQGLDGAARAAITLLFQTKALSVLSVLFGASFALLRERFAADAEFVLHYCRRMTALLLLGLLQGVLLWFNCILLLLPGLGAAQLAFRRLDPRRLAVAAGALFILGACGAGATLALGGGAATSAHGAARYFGPVGRLIGWETAVYRFGTFHQVTGFRAASFLLLAPPAFWLFGARILAGMLLGSALYQSGWFEDSAESRRRWRGCLAWGLAIGVPVQLLTVWAERASAPSAAVLVLRWTSLYVGSAALAAAYMGGSALAVWGSPRLERLLWPVAAAGRMCLTNFLAFMAAGSLLAYPYGLGLYGRLGTAAACGAGLGLYAGLLVLSVLWLGRFRFGPCEWLLRAVAYRRLI